jgi:RNAse (barnase) inhibitor barstar
MTVRIDSILAGETRPGVYRFLGRAAPETISALAEAAGWRLICLDGAKIASKAGLLDAIAVAADFPAYCGRNWDALEECLRDLSRAPARGALLLWDDARVLAKADPKAFATALSIFRSVSEYWESKGVPFVVLLRRSGRAEV